MMVRAEMPPEIRAVAEALASRGAIDFHPTLLTTRVGRFIIIPMTTRVGNHGS
jgi:sirohydrochlorin ferrochelatase